MKTLSFLALAIPFFSFAESSMPPQMADGCSLFTPNCRDVMFELYGECLFLQPNGSSLYYATEAVPFKPGIAVPADSPNWQVFEITPGYSPAFKIGAKVFFTNADTNIEANWQRLFTKDSASHTTALLTDMIGPLFDIGPNSAAYTVSHGKAKFHFDSADLVFGQQSCFFKRLYPNFFAGGAFARIKQSMESFYRNNSGIISRTIDSYSTFTGAGPKFGLDFAYRIVEGFFFNGTASVGLIIGESQNGTTYTSYSNHINSFGNPQPNVQSTTVPNRTQLVPAFEEKLGFSYALVYSCWKMSFGAGYQAQVYLNAVQSIDMTAPQVEPSLLGASVPDSAVFAVGFTRTLSNFILTGPYLSLSLDF